MAKNIESIGDRMGNKINLLMDNPEDLFTSYTIEELKAFGRWVYKQVYSKGNGWSNYIVEKRIKVPKNTGKHF
jgi:hypothetical protein